MNRDSKGRFIKGHKQPNESKEKMSIKKKGMTPWNKGKTGLQTAWNLGKIGEESLIFGANNPNWKGGITQRDKTERMSSKSKAWRQSIFERDNYTCQECGDEGVYLEAHHIKSWSEYPELRYDNDNGITLCLNCHSKTDNYKGRNRNNLITH